jgi:predicted GIY-YIG superfamily endonuclease
MEGANFLYRHFNKEGKLLYVGITNRVGRRIKDHVKTSGWFERVKSITLESFDTREDVVQAEIKAIKTENPEYNKQHKQTPRDFHKKNKSLDSGPAVAVGFKDQSVDVLLRRLVIQPVYTLKEVSALFGFNGDTMARRLIEWGDIGFIQVKNPRSRTGRMMTLITGWQLISYFEYKEFQAKKKGEPYV